jgi:hypothetical protein
MENLNIDLIANGQSTGEVANYLQSNGRLDLGRMKPFMAQDKAGTWGSYMTIYSGGDPKKPESYKTVPIQTNAEVLRRDEWKQLDAAILEPSRYRLGGVEDLISKGLVYNLGNGLGTTVLEWHDVSEAGEADMTMDGVTRSRNDRPVYQHNYLPIPIIHVDYEINARVLAASRNMGNPLDTTMAERAARRIAEKLEAMLFTDTTYAFGETDSRGLNKIYSYLNHPDRNQVGFTSVPGAHWNDSGTTGKDIVDCVLALKQVAITAYHYGPFMLYIPTAYETVIDGDYDVVSPGITIRERIMKIAGISGIKVVDKLTADNVLLVQMTPDVVRLVRGMGLTNVQWGTEGNMITKFKVMTIMVPQIRSDQNGKSGIVHLA